jgi:hypothetical protein
MKNKTNYSKPVKQDDVEIKIMGSQPDGDGLSA